VQIANNVGYFGPYEAELRGDGSGEMYYSGCPGGQNVMGIEADGTIKGCPSLPTDVYGGGSARDIDLIEIWDEKPQLAFTRGGANNAWGFCGTCYYKDVCKAGCTWMADSILQRAGNNPYCHHRTESLGRQGLRESLRQVEAAPGRSFDRGRFEIVVETEAGAETDAVARDLTPRDANASTTELVVCRGCARHVFAGTAICPFCAGDVEAARMRYDAAVADAERAIDTLREHLRPRAARADVAAIAP
jgi:radical SAM protein with 4Fe4S-binding SPASM domain